MTRRPAQPPRSPPADHRESMRLMIQIIVSLEILISCILRSEVICLAPWANQPRRTPRNRNPSGWRTEGQSARLAKGMPSVAPTLV
jgi:hypothetical protein